MKKVSHYLLVSLFLFGVWMTGVPQAKACNLTDISLISVASGPGLNMTITFRLCLGYGLTGSTKGADGATQNIAFGWYTTTTVPAFSIVSYTPTSIQSTVTTPTCTEGSFNLPNPGGALTGARIATFFTTPGSCTNRFLCVTSTTNCGNVGQLCWNYAFVVNYVPDSVRLFGAEGANNLVAGCYPNPDMKIDFTILPVLWGEVEARMANHSVNVEWSTIQETNSDVFYIERLNAGGEFESIGTMPASFNTNGKTTYSFTDVSPRVGTNTYRIVEVSKSGTSDASATTEVTFQGANTLSWGAIGPVPTHDMVKMNFVSPNAESNVALQVVDVSGKVVVAQTINAAAGTNTIDLDLTKVNAGIYFVNLKSESKSLFYKLVKE
jgi:hypothetical protein